MIDTAPSVNISSMFPVLIIIVPLALLQLRERRVRPWRMFIAPLFLMLITAIFVQGIIFSSYLHFAIMVIGLFIGIFLGFSVSSFTNVKFNKKDGTIVAKGSVIAVVLWIAMIVIRMYGEQYVGSEGFIAFNVLTAMVLMLALGTMLSRNTFIYWKYRNLNKLRTQEE